MDNYSSKTRLAMAQNNLIAAEDLLRQVEENKARKRKGGSKEELEAAMAKVSHYHAALVQLQKDITAKEQQAKKMESAGDRVAKQRQQQALADKKKVEAEKQRVDAETKDTQIKATAERLAAEGAAENEQKAATEEAHQNATAAQAQAAVEEAEQKATAAQALAAAEEVHQKAAAAQAQAAAEAEQKATAAQKKQPTEAEKNTAAAEAERDAADAKKRKLESEEGAEATDPPPGDILGTQPGRKATQPLKKLPRPKKKPKTEKAKPEPVIPALTDDGSGGLMVTLQGQTYRMFRITDDPLPVMDDLLPVMDDPQAGKRAGEVPALPSVTSPDDHQPQCDEDEELIDLPSVMRSDSGDSGALPNNKVHADEDSTKEILSSDALNDSGSEEEEDDKPDTTSESDEPEQPRKQKRTANGAVRGHGDTKDGIRKWEALTTEEKKQAQADARQMVHSLNQEELAGRFIKIPQFYRTRAFRIQEYGATFSNTSRTIAKACFLRNNGNYICGYHSEHRSSTSRDSVTGHPFKLVGVPGEKRSGKKKAAKIPSPGCFHCGCNEEEVLYEFCMWKEWTIKSTIGNKTVTEGFGSQRWDPRTRAFVVQNFQEASGLALRDLYHDEAARVRRSTKRRVDCYAVDNETTSAPTLTLTARNKVPT